MSGSSEVREIYDAAKQCGTLFSEFLAAPESEEQAWLHTAQVDFKLWCAGSKAMVSDNSSLDCRLRERQDVREVICELLLGLAKALKRCRQLIIDIASEDSCNRPQYAEILSRPSPNPVSWEAMSIESDGVASSASHDVSDPLLSEQVSYVKTILSQLVMISLAIRRAGNKSRFAKIDRTLDEQRFQNYRRHLTVVILKACEDANIDATKDFDVNVKIKRISDYKRLSEVQKRLIRTNILRRHRIESMTGVRPAENNQELLVEQPESKTETFEMVAAGLSSGGEPVVPQNTSPQKIMSPSSPMPVVPSQPPRSTALSTSTVTKIDPTFNFNTILSRRTSSGASGLTRIGNSQDFPSCPKPSPDGMLLCPLCNERLPSSYVDTKNKNNWEAHVVQDLIPYSCIAHHCENPDQMYLTAESLQVHMLEKHSVERWTCDYCAVEARGETSHVENESQLLFVSAREWKLHVLEKHGKRVPEGYHESLAKLNQRRMMEPLSCPLCSFVSNSMDTKIPDHILRHLHHFALKALPEDIGNISDPESEIIQLRPSGSEPLSHTALDNSDKAAVRTNDTLAFEELDRAISSSGSVTTRLPRLPKQPSGLDEAGMELWQSRASQLRDLLLNPDIEDKEAKEYATDKIDEMDLIAKGQGISKPLLTHEVHFGLDEHLPQPPSISTINDGVIEKLDEYFFYSVRDFLFFDNRSCPKMQLRGALVSQNTDQTSLYAGAFVHFVREEHPKHVIFWVDASTKENFEQSLAPALGRLSDIAARSVSIRDFIEYLSWSYTEKWLFVLDGLQHSTALYLASENLLPQGLRGGLFIATAEPTCLELFGTVEIINIPEELEKPAEKAKLEKPLEEGEPKALRILFTGQSLTTANAGQNPVAIQQYRSSDEAKNLLRRVLDAPHPPSLSDFQSTSSPPVRTPTFQGINRQESGDLYSHDSSRITNLTRTSSLKVFPNELLASWHSSDNTPYVALHEPLSSKYIPLLLGRVLSTTGINSPLSSRLRPVIASPWEPPVIIQDQQNKESNNLEAVNLLGLEPDLYPRSTVVASDIPSLLQHEHSRMGNVLQRLLSPYLRYKGSNDFDISTTQIRHIKLTTPRDKIERLFRHEAYAKPVIGMLQQEKSHCAAVIVGMLTMSSSDTAKLKSTEGSGSSRKDQNLPFSWISFHDATASPFDDEIIVACSYLKLSLKSQVKIGRFGSLMGSVKFAPRANQRQNEINTDPSWLPQLNSKLYLSTPIIDDYPLIL